MDNARTVLRERGQRPSAFRSPFDQSRAGEKDQYTSPVDQAKVRQGNFTRVEKSRTPAAATPAVSAALDQLQPGMLVQHDRFGEGEVTAIEGEGGNKKATVQFKAFGQKQLLLKFARLNIIG